MAGRPAMAHLLPGPRSARAPGTNRRSSMPGSRATSTCGTACSPSTVKASPVRPVDCGLRDGSGRCVGGGLIGAALTLVACADEPLGRAVPPELDAAAVLVNEHNVLSAVVSVRARHADNITVRYRLFDAAEAAASETPAVPITDETAAIPVLGLLPESRYVLRPLVSGAGGTVEGDALEIT